MTNDFENQLDKIRVELYERTEAMTNTEAVRVTNENAGKIAAQYGIKIIRGVETAVGNNARVL